MKALIVALIGVLFAAGAVSAKDVAPANEGRQLLGAEVLSTFSDTELYGVLLNGEPDWAERTTADGRVLDLNNQAALVGSWAVSDDRACYVYHGTPSNLVCYSIYEAGGDILFYDSSTNALIAKTNKIVRIESKS